MNKILREKVIKGDQRGRKLSFPTLNFSAKHANFERGVYIVKTNIDQKTYWGLMHFGKAETFEKKEESLEIHLINFSEQESYGKEAEIQIFIKIRDPKKFGTKELLINQIEADKKKLLEYIAINK